MILDRLSPFGLFRFKHLFTGSSASSFTYFASTALANICGVFFLGSKNYGEISLFLAQAGLVSSFVSLRQELLIPTSHIKVKATLDPIIISIVISSALIFTHNYFDVGFDFWAVTTGAFLAINNTLQSFYVSTANFALLSYSRINLLLPIICLIITNNFLSLSIFSELSRTYTCFLCIFTIPLLVLIFTKIKRSLWKSILRIRPRKIGLLAIPADFVNANIQLLPLSVILDGFGPALAGNYTLAVKILTIPVSIFIRLFIDNIARYLGPSKDNYFIRSTIWKKYQSTSRIFIVIASCLQVVCILLSLNLSNFSQNSILPIIILLLPAYLLKALASPVSYVLYIWNGSHYDLSFQLFFYGLMLFACTMHSNFIALIMSLSLSTFVSYLFYYLSTFRFILNYEARYT